MSFENEEGIVGLAEGGVLGVVDEIESKEAVEGVSEGVAERVAKTVEYTAEGLESSLEAVNVSDELKKAICLRFRTPFVERFFSDDYTNASEFSAQSIRLLRGEELKSFITWIFDGLPSLDVHPQDKVAMVRSVIFAITGVGSNKQSLVDAFSDVQNNSVRMIIDSFQKNYGAVASNFGAKSRNVNYAYNALLEDVVLNRFTEYNLASNTRRAA